VPFDSIEVFPGVYHESVIFDGTKSNIILRARLATLRPVIAAPPGTEAAIMIVPGAPQAPSGVQVLDFFLEGGVQGCCGLDQHDIVIMGNVVKGDILLILARFCTVSKNIVIGGKIHLDTVSNCLVEKNIVSGGGISLFPTRSAAGGNIIRHNVLRGGGISWGSGGGDAMSFNTVEANFVSGGFGIGIGSAHGGESGNIFRRNTSVENTPCDIFDLVNNGFPPNINTWKNNRFFIKCGDATD